MEYQNGDIQRIHERIDELGKDLRRELAESTKQVVNVCIALGKIETQLAMAPPLPVRPCPELTAHLEGHKEIKRPCPELSEHLTSHKETRALWQKPLVAKLIDIAIMLVFGAVMLWVGRSSQKGEAHTPQQEIRKAAQP